MKQHKIDNKLYLLLFANLIDDLLSSSTVRGLERKRFDKDGTGNKMKNFLERIQLNVEEVLLWSNFYKTPSGI